MKQKILFLILPVLLIISTSVVFYFASLLLGMYLGYLIGFLFYWFFWCLFIPLFVSKKSIVSFFKNEKPLFVKKNWWIIVLFFSTIIVPIFMYFIPGLSSTPTFIIILSVPFAIMNGFFEELFWRGFYIKEFPNNILWSVLIPSVFFSLWHIAPQFSILDENVLVFIISTLPLGFTYAIVAYVTKSAKWSALGHSLSGILALSGLLASSFFQIIK